MSIQIHGKEYITVAERVIEAHKELKRIDITTEVLFQEPIVIKATVKTPKGTFTGISAANPSKAIEKVSPYEVAETSAVGRALGFAGYGLIDSIASADEVVNATKETPKQETVPNEECPTCGAPLVEGKTKAGKTFWKCSTQKYDYKTRLTSGCAYVNWSPTKEEDNFPDLKDHDDAKKSA